MPSTRVKPRRSSSVLHEFRLHDHRSELASKLRQGNQFRWGIAAEYFVMHWIPKILGLGALAIGMMNSAANSSTTHSIYIEYPAFRTSNPPVDPRSLATIDMINNKGVVNELLINCGGGRSGILIESKIEGLFCGPDHDCVSSLKTAVLRLCR